MTTNVIEILWRGDPARFHNGICDDCGEGRMVARQDRSRIFQCLDCFTAKPTGHASLRKRVREVKRAATRTAGAVA